MKKLIVTKQQKARIKGLYTAIKKVKIIVDLFELKLISNGK